MIQILMYINGQNVSPWTDWTATELHITRNEQELTLSVQLKDVKLIETAFTTISATFPDTYTVKIVVNGLIMLGKIYPSSVRMSHDYCLCDIDVDLTSNFARSIEGRLLAATDFVECEYLVASRTNAQAILTLSVSTFILSYLLAKEVYELGKDVAIILGIAGAGVTGPASATVAQVTIAALRVVYIAALIAAIYQLIQQLKDYLELRKKTIAIRLDVAINKYAQQAGYHVGMMPSWFNKVWLVGGDITDYEASEIFSFAKNISKTIIYVWQQTINFIDFQSSYPVQMRRGWEEYYYYNFDNVARREIISLLRDTSDEHCLDEPAAIEIVRDYRHRGYERIDLSAAPARVAQDRPLLQYIQQFNSALSALVNLIGGGGSGITANNNIIMTEREIFARKVVFANSLNYIPVDHTRQLLEIIKERYVSNRLAKIYENVKMPFSWNDLQSLMANGYPGIIELRWHIYDEYAFVTYQQLVNLQTVVNVKIL